MECGFIYNQKTALVQTAKGKIRGYQYHDVDIFKGIPYAHAQRFHRPESVKAWEGELDATSYGYCCPVPFDLKPDTEMLIPQIFWVTNEDCMNLNIWKPVKGKSKKPVVVWIHGGGFSSGNSIEQYCYNGENMAREGNVVVVSVNHRLNILGYFDLSAFGDEYENSGNAGMDDLIEALRWIHDNISCFGGDPDNVTLIGQSGGGGKITALLQMPAADGLFHKAIIMSGIFDPRAMGGGYRGDGKEIALALMEELGIDSVKELEKVPYKKLVKAYRKVTPAFSEKGKYTGSAPFKNKYYAGDPLEVGFRKESANVKLIAGSVFGEMNSLAAFRRRPADDAYPKGISEEETEVGRKLIRSIYGRGADEMLPLFEKAFPERNPADLQMMDMVFRRGLLPYCKERAKLNPDTWVYMFNQDFSVGGGLAPWHCADIPYVFHNTELVPVEQIEGVTDYLEEQIFGSMMSFVHSGNPNYYKIPVWDAVTPEHIYTMIFDADVRQKTDFDEQLLETAAKYISSKIEFPQLDD